MVLGEFEDMSFTRKKTLLITGINGFLGSHLANDLIEDYHIIGLGYSIDKLGANLNFPIKVYSSLNSNLEAIFIENKIDAIIHTATVYQKFENSFEKLIKTNILLPVQLLELSNKYKVSLFINTDTFFNQPNSNYSYLSHYTLSKRHFLDWLKEIKGDCLLVNMKLFHLYGPNDSVNKFIPSTILRLINNDDKFDLTLGEQKRDLIFVDDVVNSYRVILQNLSNLSVLENEYEVGTGIVTSIRDIVLLLQKLCNSRTELNFGVLNYRENEIMYAKANNAALFKLGWTVNNSLHEGLIKTINYYSKVK